jgi:hypothetical protein
MSADQPSDASAKTLAVLVLIIKALTLRAGGVAEIDAETLLRAEGGFDLKLTGRRDRLLRVSVTPAQDPNVTKIVLPDDNPLVRW